MAANWLLPSQCSCESETQSAYRHVESHAGIGEPNEPQEQAGDVLVRWSLEISILPVSVPGACHSEVAERDLPQEEGGQR